jgi:hypothetical protein
MWNERKCAASQASRVYFRSEIQPSVDHDSPDRLCVRVGTVNNGVWSHRTKANEYKLCDPAVVMMISGRVALAYLDLHSNAG